eukprot:gnl/TRDRNA2_/TRDRNA2_78063_c0_seq1.p1 gnl/TRDRNA2_/TRDRNA2_78063_c0~~gnl/TRDRNA2_/TRDRNA2_78063_c0_seq1.p1  ORF type:complete len:485 (+),score=70.25 gnl/TRDRNA2_/TRDRNA2_78063_c0_seq1:122-1456(+)
MFANVTGVSLVTGSGAGAGPLISQAFGANNFVRCGDLLQRQVGIHVVLVAFISAVWLSTEQILVAFRQPLRIARLTAQFMRWRIAGLPFFAVREDMRTYLCAQRVMVSPMVVSIFANLFNIATFPLLISRFGFIGAPLAITIADGVHAVLMTFLAKWALPHAEAWPRWNLRTAFTDWGEMLGLALPSAVMMLSEWWGWEVNLFFAGMLCPADDLDGICVELDVFPIVSNTMVISFMVHIGFSIAAGTQVGNALGGGDVAKARRASHVTLFLVIIIAGAVASMLIVLREPWARLFSEDDQMIRMTTQVIPLIATYIFFDAMGPGALVSLLRGMGLVRLPALAVFVSFYVLGIPVGLLLTFAPFGGRLGIFGLWTGLDVGMICMVASLLCYFCCGVDWCQAAAVAQTKAQAANVTDLSATSKVEGQVLGKSAYESVNVDDAVAADA